MKLLLTVLIFLSTVVHAHADWEQCSGPYRGEVTNIIEHNGYLYALIVDDHDVSNPKLLLSRSKDNGGSWQPLLHINASSYQGHVNRLIIVNNILYVIDNLYNSWISTDNGESWSRLFHHLLYQNLTKIVQDDNIYDITKIDGRYIVVTDRGVYATDNDGLEWKKKYNYDYIVHGWPRLILGKLYHVENRLYLTTNEGLYYSKNNGETWEKDSITNKPVFTVFEHNGTMVIGVEDGMYRSSNKGERWEFTWIKDNIVISFSSRYDTLYCATTSRETSVSCGLFCSTDQGKTWHSNSVFRKLSDSRSFYFKDSIMLVGTFDNGIYRSNDGGKTWLQTGGIAQKISALTSLNGKLVVAPKISPNCYPQDIVCRIYTSTKDRSAWLLSDFDRCTIYSSVWLWFYLLSVSDSIVFATSRGYGTDFFNDRLCMSKDGGISWDCIEVHGIIFRRSNLQIDSLFVYNYDVNYFSTDNGESWHNLSRKLTFYDNYVVTKTGAYFSKFVYHPNYEIPDKGELYISKDKATTWQKIQVMDAKILYCLYEKEGTVYVSTDKGIYSTQDGINWQNYGLSTIKVSALTIVDNFLYAGTDDGLYKRELLISSLEEPSSESSIHIYPNPTDETVNIEGASPGSLVSIYDATGERVLEIEASSGTIDISTLSPGYYTVIIQGQTSRTRSSLCIMR